MNPPGFQPSLHESPWITADSNIVHEGTPAKSCPTVTSSTPIKPKSDLERLFSTYPHFRDPSVNAIGQEMKCSVVGPMPVQDFLAHFLPTTSITGYTLLKNNSFKAGLTFRETINANDEVDMYTPFVSGISSYMLRYSPSMPQGQSDKTLFPETQICPHSCSRRQEEWICI